MLYVGRYKPLGSEPNGFGLIWFVDFGLIRAWAPVAQW